MRFSALRVSQADLIDKLKKGDITSLNVDIRYSHLMGGEPVQRSLFAPVIEDGFNEMEKQVACFLDEQQNLMLWYRNVQRQDYAVQGWQRHRIYPNFIFAKSAQKNDSDHAKVYVVETKGVHLKNEDTDYKRAVFEICNSKAFDKQIDLAALDRTFKQRETRFEIVFGDEWQKRLGEMLAA